jgi:hypothetical protein
VRLDVAVRGSVADIIRGEVDRAKRAVRAGIERTTMETQAEMRRQTQSAFGPRAQGLSRAWRAKVFPRGPSLRAAGLVYTQAPEIVDAFDRGATIRPGGGKKFLAIPTALNRQGGRRGSQPRVTPAEMLASKAAFVIPAKRGGARLWCLRASEAQTRGRGGRVSRQVIAGFRYQVATGRGGGRTADGARRMRQREVQQRLLDQGFVPMFVLLPSVTLPRRFDVDAGRRFAAARAARNILAAWGST